MSGVRRGIAEGFAYLWRAGRYFTRYAVNLATGRIQERVGEHVEEIQRAQPEDARPPAEEETPDDE